MPAARYFETIGDSKEQKKDFTKFVSKQIDLISTMF